MYPSVTYTITDGTTLDASHFNVNNADLTNALSDGSTDLFSASLMSRNASLADSTVTGNILAGRLMVHTFDATHAELCADSSVCATGSIYSGTDGWVDWYANANLIGWNKMDTTKILYRKVGDEVSVSFHLDGTVSTSTQVNFRLPYAASEYCQQHNVIYAIDDSTNVVDKGYNAMIGPGAGGGSKALAIAYPNWYVFGWTASQPTAVRRVVKGNFKYIVEQ